MLKRETPGTKNIRDQLAKDHKVLFFVLAKLFICCFGGSYLNSGIELVSLLGRLILTTELLGSLHIKEEGHRGLTSMLILLFIILIIVITLNNILGTILAACMNPFLFISQYLKKINYGYEILYRNIYMSDKRTKAGYIKSL